MWKRDEPKSPLQVGTGHLNCTTHGPIHSTNERPRTAKKVSQVASIVDPPGVNKSPHVTVSDEAGFFGLRS